MVSRGQRVHWGCDEGEIDLTGLRVRAVTGTPHIDEDLSVTVGGALAQALTLARCGTRLEFSQGSEALCHVSVLFSTVWPLAARSLSRGALIHW